MADRGRRRNNAGIDVADINGLLARQKSDDSIDERDDEPLPKYGSADEFYDLEEEIGKGAYGVVKKCIDKRSKEECAAKIVKTSNSKLRKETMKEIEVMKALGKHKKLVCLIDAYHTPFEIVMILELVAGGELFERIVEEDYLMEEDAIDYVRQVLEGLQFMHAKNIVHLDLKPENILCVSKDSMNIKLVDFGLAQQLKDGEEIKSSFGTPDFVAPEVIRMKPVSKASDMWSLGVVTYVLLSGLMPFSGDTDKDTLIKVAKADWDFDDECFDDLSEEAKDFIEDLLQKDPSERLTIQDCLTHPWLTNQLKVVHKIDTVKHKSFLAKRRWKKSINALVAVRRMSSLSPSLTNRRPSMDTALLAARKADKTEDPEERKSSVPTLSTENTEDHLDKDTELDFRKPRSNTFTSPSHLGVENVFIGNSLGTKSEDSVKKKQELNNNETNVCKVNLNGQRSQPFEQPLPHQQIVFQINPNELQTGLTKLQNGNQRSTKVLDLAGTSANFKTQSSDVHNPGQKITVNLNTGATTNKRDSGEQIPSIVLNDENPLTPDGYVTPGSPRRISTDNYFITQETTVDNSTYVLDSWADSKNNNSEQLNTPADSKVCIRTVDQKGQTITVKLDGFSSVELPVNKSTSSHVRRASTGSDAIEFFTQTIQQKLV